MTPRSVQASPGPRLPPRLVAWREERRAFDRLLPRLTARLRGRYVAVHGGQVVGSDVDPEALFERLWRQLLGKTFFIGWVGGPPPIVEIPSFSIE